MTRGESPDRKGLHCVKDRTSSDPATLTDGMATAFFREQDRGTSGRRAGCAHQAQKTTSQRRAGYFTDLKGPETRCRRVLSPRGVAGDRISEKQAMSVGVELVELPPTATRSMSMGPGRPATARQAGIGTTSSGSGLVLVDDAAEHVVPDDPAARDRGRRPGEWLGELESSVRPCLIVVAEVVGDHGFEVSPRRTPAGGRGTRCGWSARSAPRRRSLSASGRASGWPRCR